MTGPSVVVVDGMVVVSARAAAVLYPVVARAVARERVTGPVADDVVDVLRSLEVAARVDLVWGAARAAAASAATSDLASVVDGGAEVGGLSVSMRAGEVAELLEVTPRRARQLGEAGLGSKTGGSWRFARRDVEAYAASRTTNPLEDR